jgi:NADH:quinone reductase (non-electrogenic)
MGGDRLPHVVIVGGGFGGLLAALGLGRAPVRVTLVDRTNHHLFQPLLYQVAMAALSPADIAVPIRGVVHRQRNTTVLLAEATAVDLAVRTVTTSAGPLVYDYLVLAAGARTHYFGHDDWAAAAPGLKTIDDAIAMRRRVLMALEEAEQTADPLARARLLTFVVIGGGPTGVELAGTLSELLRYMVKRDYRSVRPNQLSVILLEGAPDILLPFRPEMRESAVRQLEAIGVEVRRGTRVAGIDARGVDVDTASGRTRIEAATVLWAAGVRAAPIAASLGIALDRAGRVAVGPSMTIPGHDEVFVIGDIAACTEARGQAVPGIAPAAMQAGRFAARAIIAAVAGRPRPVFAYVDKGILAAIGRKAAVAQFRHFGFSGLLAWLLWMAVHIFFLIGFRNRFIVMMEWAWHYLTFERGARLITGGVLPPGPAASAPAASPPAAPPPSGATGSTPPASSGQRGLA